MNTGTTTRHAEHHRGLARALLLGLLLLAPGWAGALTVEQLMAGLAARGPLRDQFVETKHLSILSGTIEIRGTLEFRPPGYLRREHTAPRVETYEIDGGTITVSQADGKRKQLVLADYPPLAAFVESLRAILGGDTATVERLFHTELSGDEASWSLKLTPREQPLADYIDVVVLAGERQHLLRIETQEPTGDRSVLEIIPSQP